MANNFALITKSAGVVTPALDGSVFNAILFDVRLQGMTSSYSGANVNFTAGSMLVGGRVINNPSASSITLNATDGYCWLIVTINNDVLSFRQTTSEPTLTQNNINVSGTKYEAIIYKAHLTSGSIDSCAYVMPYQWRTGGIIDGTDETPPSGNYANRTIYIQHEA